MVEPHSILVLSLCYQSIAGKPVVKDVVKEQARPILLFNTRLIRPRVVEMPYPDRYQRIVIRRYSMLLGYPIEYGTDVSAHYFEYWLDFRL